MTMSPSIQTGEIAMSICAGIYRVYGGSVANFTLWVKITAMAPLGVLGVLGVLEVFAFV